MAGRLPDRWHWVNGRDKSQGARDPEGNVHSRGETERRGANESGFRSVREERKARAQYREWEQGLGRRGKSAPQWDIDNRKAREAAEARGQNFGRKEQARLDAARVGMQFGGDDGAKHSALDRFLYLTGRTDRPNAGY